MNGHSFEVPVIRKRRNLEAFVPTATSPFRCHGGQEGIRTVVELAAGPAGPAEFNCLQA
jgi:hypothetical protein